jgi:hypothetical protein
MKIEYHIVSYTLVDSYRKLQGETLLHKTKFGPDVTTGVHR